MTKRVKFSDLWDELAPADDYASRVAKVEASWIPEVIPGSRDPEDWPDWNPHDHGDRQRALDDIKTKVQTRRKDLFPIWDAVAAFVERAGHGSVQWLAENGVGHEDTIRRYATCSKLFPEDLRRDEVSSTLYYGAMDLEIYHQVNNDQRGVGVQTLIEAIDDPEGEAWKKLKRAKKAVTWREHGKKTGTRDQVYQWLVDELEGLGPDARVQGVLRVYDPPKG